MKPTGRVKSIAASTAAYWGWAVPGEGGLAAFFSHSALAPSFRSLRGANAQTSCKHASDTPCFLAHNGPMRLVLGSTSYDKRIQADTADPGLENRLRRKVYGGSNPSSSARFL